jgi:hypothetical protein
MRTASVRLPTALSPPMSRRLFVTRIAQASSPTPTEATMSTPVTARVWTYAVPTTGTTPKKTNTKTSPSPA